MQASMFSDIFAQIESRFSPIISETGFYDHDARVAAISTIEKRIDTATHAWRQFLCSLFTRRNTLVPISLLPPEILSRVFHLLVAEERPLSGKRQLPVGWIRVTHVCRHWRQVAIDDLSLWAKIWGISKRTEWISEMLARAKNAPLDIELYDVNSETLLMILPRLHHTRQLRLKLYDYHSDTSDVIQEIFSSEVPALEHFELTAPYFPYSPFTFPDLGGNMLFKGQAPKLRTFTLSEFIIPGLLVPRGQLTRLKIAITREVVDLPGDLNELIDLLVNCPALEILALEYCLPSQLIEFPHGRTIHLPHLSHLCLRGTTSRIMNMLKMLKLPSSTMLHLHCNFELASIHNDPQELLLTFISAQFQSRPTSVEFKSLTVSIDWSNTVNIIASTFPSTLRNCQTRSFKDNIVGNPELVLSYYLAERRSTLPGLLKQACKKLPISNLEFISMSVPNKFDISRIYWVELFGCCTNVTTMKAIWPGTSSLVRALITPTTANPGSSRQGRKRKCANRESTVVQPANTLVYLFPKLKFLEVSKQKFVEGKDNPSGILFDVFERGLQQRMAASEVPLKSLCVSRCDISTERANDLRKLVQYFHWDEDDKGLSGV
jgi:hypothetical protein